MKVVITQDTFLKAFPIQAKQLEAKAIPDQLITVKAGTALSIVDQFPYEGDPNSAADDHVLVQLDTPPTGHQERRWFVYGAHAKVEGTEPNNNPKQDPPILELAKAESVKAESVKAESVKAESVKAESVKAEQLAQTESIKVEQPKPKPAPDFGPKIFVPGISRPIGIYEPIYFEPKPSNFSWAELTKGGARIPVDATVTQRIVKLAKYLDEVRAFLGNQPMRVTSGYRDPVSNREVGGARDSRHMYGDAVDFWIEGQDVVDTFNRLKNYHTKGGLAVGNGFVHIDLRPGAPARWTYPGGPQVSLW
jgi:hypothetical protein